MNTVNYAARRESAENLPKGQRIRLAHPKDRAAAAQDRKDQTGTEYWARGNQLAMALTSRALDKMDSPVGPVRHVARRIVNKAMRLVDQAEARNAKP